MIGALYETKEDAPVVDIVLTNGGIITPGINEFLQPKGRDVNGDGGISDEVVKKALAPLILQR